MQVQLSEQRHAELNDYAQRHGQDPSTALDEVLADALAWDRLDYQEAVEGIRKGYEDLKAGRTKPVSEMFRRATRATCLDRSERGASAIAGLSAFVENANYQRKHLQLELAVSC